MRLLTVAETAERLGVKIPTIRLWLTLRKLEYVKLSRAVRVPESEVERLIRDNTISARESRKKKPEPSAKAQGFEKRNARVSYSAPAFVAREPREQRALGDQSGLGEKISRPTQCKSCTRRTAPTRIGTARQDSAPTPRGKTSRSGREPRRSDFPASVHAMRGAHL
jgi:excisionase family DNA binding protein